MRSVSLATSHDDFSRSQDVSIPRCIEASLRFSDSEIPTAGLLREERGHVKSESCLAYSDAHLVTAPTSTCADGAMDRYARGDDAAFVEVYDAIAPRIHAYLVRQTRDRGLADDLLQQTFFQIHRKRGTYMTGCPVLPWAFAIARRLHIDALRRRKLDALSSARVVDEEESLDYGLPDDEMMSRETACLVQAALERMPENQRAAFELLRVDGLSVNEAAQSLGTTVNAVKLRAFRAYTALRAALERAVDTPSISEPPSAT